MDFEQGFQLSDLPGLLRRRARTAVLVGGAVILVMIFVASVLPNQYDATATLLVEPQTISPKLVEAGIQDSDLNDRLHLIQMQILSRARLSRVIDAFKLYKDKADDMTREEIIEFMRDQIRIVPVLPQFDAQAGVRSKDVQINTFQLSYRHENPKTAADVANRLANDFIDEHIRERVQTSGDTSEFIEAELARLSSRMKETDAQIAAIKSENSGQLPEDIASNQRLQERLIESMRDAQRDLAIAESDQAFYRQQVLTGASDFYKYRNDDTPERRLEELKLSLNEDRSKGYTDKHPDVVAVKAEIAELQQRMQETASKEGGNLSIAQQNAKAEQQRAALRADSARKSIAALKAQIDALDRKLGATPQVAEKLNLLEQEQQHLLESFRSYSSKRLDAAVAADMERRQKGEKFRLLEPAVADPEPASPNRPIIVLAGVVLGGMIGLAAALLAEALDTSFHDERSIQQRFHLPVLASVPSVVLEGDRAVARSRRIRELVTVFAVAAFVCIASLVGNWVVNGTPGAVEQAIEGSTETTTAPSTPPAAPPVAPAAADGG